MTGVVAGSAGNHAQSLAYARDDSVDECVELARARAEEGGLLFAHPFDDLEVIAGQAGVGLEILAERPELGTVVVAIGGGGLLATIAEREETLQGRRLRFSLVACFRASARLEGRYRAVLARPSPRRRQA